LAMRALSLFLPCIGDPESEDVAPQGSRLHLPELSLPQLPQLGARHAGQTCDSILDLAIHGTVRIAPRRPREPASTSMFESGPTREATRAPIRQINTNSPAEVCGFIRSVGERRTRSYSWPRRIPVASDGPS
jgi:hypothetical protein